MNADDQGMQQQGAPQYRPEPEDVAERAYRIWEEEGRPAGQEEEHWRRAEAELIAEHETTAASAAPATAGVRKAKA